MEQSGYFSGDADPFINPTSLGPFPIFKGEDREGAMLTFEGVETVEETTDFRGEDESDPAEVMIDLKGRVDEYILMFDLGDAGGVIVMDDLSKREPAVVTGDVLEVKTEVEENPLKVGASAIVEALIGETVEP